MNTKKIAFIICVNNEKYMEECRYYISKLDIPNGYETDIIEVREAESMTSGYQAAMESSDAKFKIYMHQDICLINRKMLYRMLEIFSDSSIGIIGTLGGKLYPDGYVHPYWNRGSTLNAIYDGVKAFKFEQSPVYEEVEAVDGMFMATQYDLDWDMRFSGWHMYDVTQCIRFRQAGYKVCVSTEDFSWTLHDAGYCDITGYADYRNKLFECYPEYFYDRNEVVREISKTDNDEVAIDKLYQEIVTAETNNYGQSKYANMSIGEFWDEYCTVKFPVRRMEFGFPREDWSYIKNMVLQKRITITFLFSVINHVCIEPELMALEMERLFEDDPEVVFYDQYQRYHTLARILEQCKKLLGMEKVTLLEVGANANLNMEKEDKADTIYYTDLEVPVNRKYDNRYFAADATNLSQIADDSYDFCISADVFEHIPPEKRDSFISELYRVCKYAVIMCFPQGMQEVVDAEKYVNDVYNEVHGDDNSWLNEHEEFGLPKSEKLEAFLSDKGIEFETFSHGYIENWIKMQLICGFVDSDKFRQIVSDANFEYNKDFYQSDIGPVNYRAFYLLKKDNKGLAGFDKKVIFDFSCPTADLSKGHAIEKAYSLISEFI
jgi:hypothetical protein